VTKFAGMVKSAVAVKSVVVKSAVVVKSVVVESAVVVKFVVVELCVNVQPWWKCAACWWSNCAVGPPSICMDGKGGHPRPRLMRPETVQCDPDPSLIRVLSKADPQGRSESDPSLI
jgi:hypothetical protein